MPALHEMRPAPRGEEKARAVSRAAHGRVNDLAKWRFVANARNGEF
jgi:hypothetical protein